LDVTTAQHRQGCRRGKQDPHSAQAWRGPPAGPLRVLRQSLYLAINTLHVLIAAAWLSRKQISRQKKLHLEDQIRVCNNLAGGLQ